MKRLPRHKKLARRARLRRHARGGSKQRLIRISYETITPGDEDDDEPGEDRGWIDEEGHEISLDEFDRQDGLTIADVAVKFLKNDGAWEASSSAFHKGIWYSTDYDTDFRTGESTQKSYHLDGFTESEEREIFNEMKRRW